MRGNEFLDKMELIDPAYIEAADAAPKAGRKIRTGWRAAVAACICLVVLTGTAAAVSGGGTWLIGLFIGEKEVTPDTPISEYVLGAKIRKFPVSELPAEMVAAVLRDPDWKKEFSTAEEAWEFMGLDALKKPEWDIGKTNGTVVLTWGNNNGEITDIAIGTVYEADDIVLQTHTGIYTEYWDDEDGWMARGFGEEVGYTESFYTTPSGKQCQIIFSSSPSYGRWRMDAYLTDGGILYALYVNYGSEQDAARAEEFLRQWADMF